MSLITHTPDSNPMKSEANRLIDRIAEESKPAFQTIRNVLARNGLPALNDADLSKAIKKALHEVAKNEKDNKKLKNMYDTIHDAMKPEKRAQSLNTLDNAIQDILDKIKNLLPGGLPQPAPQPAPKQADKPSVADNVLDSLIGQQFVAMLDKHDKSPQENAQFVSSPPLFNLKNTPSKVLG